jgi:arylsulfatase A-like enzyme
MYLNDEQVKRSYELHRHAYGSIVRALDFRFNLEGPDFMALSDREVLKGQYEAAIRYLDDRIRELITSLNQRGLLDNTMVIITSDHGEYLDTHGMWSHRFLIYEDVTRVTLMIREPGRTEALHIDTPVQLTDVYPTVASVALGVAGPPPHHDARDLLELAQSPGEPRIAVAEYNGPGNEMLAMAKAYDSPIVRHRFAPAIAAQDGRFKYIASSDGQREFYDLIADPGERNNLIESRPEEARRLAEYISRWLDAVPQYRPTRPGGVPALDPDTERALRSLGYLGG